MKTSTSFSFLLFVLIMISGCRDGNLQKNSASADAGIALPDSVKILDSLSSMYKVSNNPLARTYSQSLLDLANRLNTGAARADAYLCMGMTYNYFNRDSSYLFYSIALKIAEEFNLDKLRSRTMYNLATFYSDASARKTAIVYLDSVRAISRRIGDYTTLSNTFNALGNQKFDLADNSGSRMMYDSAYQVALRYSLSKQTGVALASLSRFEDKPDLRTKMRKQALAFLEKQPGNEEEISSILNNIGMYSHNPDTAIGYYRRAIKTAESGKLPGLEIAAYNNMAYSFLDKNDWKQAEACLVNHAIPLAKKDDNSDMLATIYDTYADVMTAAKKTDEALKQARMAYKSRVLSYEKMGAEQIRLLSALLDVKNKELKLEMNSRDLREKETSMRRIIIWFSLSVMILVMIIFVVILNGQRNKLRFQVELIGSAKKLIDLEEVMKGRVAMELHDLTTPFYFTMLQQIEKAKITDPGIADDMKSKVSVMAKNIREISHRMNNDFIGQMTIRELVNGLCDNLKETSNVLIFCEIGSGEFNLSKEETIHIYRIIQELLTNAVKYVSSGEINLSLTMEEGMVFILYEDSGPGFNMHSPGTKGLGILNIFERAKIINGKAVLNSSPGSGTKWNISIPHPQVAS